MYKEMEIYLRIKFYIKEGCEFMLHLQITVPITFYLENGACWSKLFLIQAYRFNKITKLHT